MFFCGFKHFIIISDSCTKKDGGIKSRPNLLCRSRHSFLATIAATRINNIGYITAIVVSYCCINSRIQRFNHIWRDGPPTVTAIAMKTFLVNTIRRYASSMTIRHFVIFLAVSFLLSPLVFPKILVHFPFVATEATTAVFAKLSTMIYNVKSYNLLEGVGTQKPAIMHRPKERSHHTHHPSNHKQNPNNLAREQRRICRPSPPTVKPAHVSGSLVHPIHQVWRGEQSDRQRAPDSINHVDRNGIDRVVDFPLNQELRACQVQRTRDQSDDDAGPALHDGTSCGDCYQSTQTSIHGILQIESNFASKVHSNDS
mmetsp:Transcript_10866/g.17184  ORF Transcript_10866/g.17184 Transcript_10866/m.17184 type:complete len:312 (-) Transcript_10866:1186-2121(-)